MGKVVELTKKEGAPGKQVAVRIGHLLPGGEPVGTGATRPIKGMAATTAGEITVIAKRLALRQISIETICAVFGRLAGLPIPEPILLLDESQQWLYGSVYSEHPNFAQYASLAEASVIHELEKWPQLSSAACFDEIIANPDRNDENLLYDGSGFVLIDHDMCLPAGMAADDSSDDYYTNALLELRLDKCKDARESMRVMRELLDWAEGIPSGSIEQAQAKSSAIFSEKSIKELSGFLEQRVDNLAELLENKINPTQQQRLKLHVKH